MHMTKQQFESYLALYGARLENWPQGLRKEAAPFMRLPEFFALAEQHARLEAQLRERRYQPPSKELAERIILTSLSVHQHPVGRVMMRLQELLAAILIPKPALAFMLLVGLFIGFSASPSPLPAEEDFTYLEDNGAIL